MLPGVKFVAPHPASSRSLTPQEQHGDVFYTLPLSSTLTTLTGIMSCCQTLQWLRVLEDVTRASADQSVQQKNNIWGEDLLRVL